MKMTLSTFLFISFSLKLFAAPEDLSFTVNLQSKKETAALEFVAPSHHHFNAEAPNHVSALIEGQWIQAEKLEAHGPKFEASWARKFNPCDGVKAELYICDDKNTYCLPRTQNFKCINSKLTVTSENLEKAKSSGAEKSESKSAVGKESSFIVNDSDKALKLAQSLHKPLLIDFFGIWCPPCNELDETVFNSAEFSKAQENFVLLKLDADSTSAWALKSKYHVTGYPTVIMATESGDEISRIIGYRPKTEFVASMNRAYKDRDQGLSALIEKAEKSDKAAFDVGLKFLEREDYYKAHYYLLKASRHWSLADIKRNKLMTSQLGLMSKAQNPEDKRVYAQLLTKALEWYPRQIEVFDRTDSLIEAAEELQDKALGRRGQEVRIETAQWYIKHPKALRGTDWVKGDLYEVLGRSFEVIDEKQKSLDAYATGAQEYLKEIVRSGLDAETERGYNLERIYCLWKSGQIDAAQALYEKFEKEFPEEFTFYYQHAKLLKEIRDYKVGIEKAEKALKYSYGDNKLRVTALLAELYQSSGDKKKALDVLNKTLDHFQLPDDKTIRSHKYYQSLLDLRNSL